MSLFAGVKTGSGIDVKASIKDQSGKTIKVILKLEFKVRHDSFFRFMPCYFMNIIFVYE